MTLLLSLFLSIFFVSAISENVLQPIDGINGIIRAVEFDSNGNAYVATSINDIHQLHKLNSAKEILWTIKTTDPTLKIIINSQNVIYLDSDLMDFSRHLSILREETLEIERIDGIQGDSLFLDEEDNLIYNGDYGITILRPNSTTSILVKNLENFIFIEDEKFGIDKKGNIYIGGYTFPEYESSVAVITKEAKQESIPYAIHYKFVYGNFPDSVIIDENDGAWIFTGDLNAISQLYKISNGNITKVFTDERYESHRGKAVKDRIYVVSITLYSDTAPTYFLTLDGEIHKIPDLDEVPTQKFFRTYIEADEDGNTYIGSYYSYDKGPLVRMEPEDENTTWIDFPGTVNIRSMTLDGNGDLWLVTEGQGVFSVKKGETVAVKVSSQDGVDTNLTGDISVNKITNEVFILGYSNLYVVSKDSV